MPCGLLKTGQPTCLKSSHFFHSDVNKTCFKCVNLFFNVLSVTFFAYYTGCYRVRSMSFPGSTLVCPGMYVQIALTSFQGPTRVSPNCPVCGTGHLGLAPGAYWPLVHDVTTRGRVIVRLALVRGSARSNEHRRVDTGKLIERTHFNPINKKPVNLRYGGHNTMTFKALDIIGNCQRSVF